MLALARGLTLAKIQNYIYELWWAPEGYPKMPLGLSSIWLKLNWGL